MMIDQIKIGYTVFTFNYYQVSKKQKQINIHLGQSN